MTVRYITAALKACFLASAIFVAKYFLVRPRYFDKQFNARKFLKCQSLEQFHLALEVPGICPFYLEQALAAVRYFLTSAQFSVYCYSNENFLINLSALLLFRKHFCYSVVIFAEFHFLTVFCLTLILYFDVLFNGDRSEIINLLRILTGLNCF